MAEAYLKERQPDWTVVSAGTDAQPGAPASHHARTVVAEIGLELADHRSRCLQELEITEFDEIFVMSQSHQRGVLKHTRSRLLTSLLGKSSDIEDPFGAGLVSYRAAFQEIRKCLDVLS